jgi:hypothetical protein
LPDAGAADVRLFNFSASIYLLKGFGIFGFPYNEEFVFKIVSL